MNRTADLLGQTKVVEQLLSHFSSPNSRAWLSGQSGTGKTTIREMVSLEINSAVPVICLLGDVVQYGTKYFSLYRALQGTRLSKRIRDSKTNAITSPLLSIPIVGATLAELAKLAVDAYKGEQIEFLSSEQQDILHGLQCISKNDRLLIIVDEVNSLDDASAELFLLFSLPEINRVYSFTKKASFLFIENTETKLIINQLLLKKLRAEYKIELARITRSDFLPVLVSFGLVEKIEEDLLNELYDITCGHLEITKQIAKTINLYLNNNFINNNNPINLMADLLCKRLSGNNSFENVQRMLCIASCIGCVFSETEIRCVYNDDESFSDILTLAIKEQLLKSDGINIQFKHDSIRAASKHLIQNKVVKIHEKIVECVKLIRPGDFTTRLRHAVITGNKKLIADLSFSLSLQFIRGERTQRLPTHNIEEIDQCLVVMQQAYKLMDTGYHKEAISILMSFYNGEFGIIQGEISGLIALNQIKLRKNENYEAAASILEYWVEWDEEPDLWQRLMSILVTAWAFSGKREKATKLYIRLVHSLIKNAANDPTLKNRAEALRRKADLFLTTEISIKHIEKATYWFSPFENTDTPRHSFEYTACLINLSAAHYTLGQFKDATNIATSALNWIKKLQQRGLRTAEAYKAINNFAISAFRGSIITAKEASEALGLLITDDSSCLRFDRSLIAVNQSALLLLMNETNAARSLLESVICNIKKDNIDDYYALYAVSNYAVALAMANERKQALTALKETELYLHSIPKWFENYFTKRISLMKNAIIDGKIKTAIGYDNFPQSANKPDNDQDAWWSIGRGLLLSDIQVWSE